MGGGEDRSKSSASAVPVEAATPPVVSAVDGVLAPEERKKVLDRTVFELSREFRAEVRSRHDFDALLIRGRPVTHRLHFIVLVLVVAITAALGRRIGFGDAFLVPAVFAGGGYGLVWLALTMTGGESRERLSIDERGKIASVKSGHGVEARSDFLRVAIPTAILICSGYLSFGLIRDLVFAPHPNCNVQAQPGTDACLRLPNLGGLMGAAKPSASASVAPAASPTADASALTVSQAQTVERVVRGFQLLFAGGAAIASAWFIRRMLTGRWVAAIRPVHHRLSDE